MNVNIGSHNEITLDQHVLESHEVQSNRHIRFSGRTAPIV